jgi:hypothetical protein
LSKRFDKVKISIFATPKQYKTYDAKNEQKIVDIIRKQVLPREKAEYLSVKVKVKRKPDGSPKYLEAYMLRKDTYTADVVRVDIDENYQVKAFKDDYAPSDDEEEDEEKAKKGPAYEAFDFVVGTPVPEIATAKEAVETIHQMAVNSGLKSKILLGADASVANYKSYLKSGVMGFVNVGHGNTSLIVLSDGTLTASWFQSLSGKPLAPAVVYFNSCQVFNNPLQPAIMAAGARTFVGGIVNLAIGPSEKVCKCFWSKVMTQNGLMGPALKDCEKSNYPAQGAHGIAGDLNYFNFISSVIDKYHVVIYGEDGSAGNLEAFIHCYSGTTNSMTCEFYTDGSALPQNRFAGGRVGLVYPWSKFSSVLDVLRSEKPVYFGFILTTKVGYVRTALEPTGEGPVDVAP